jgi:hypothetical protein
LTADAVDLAATAQDYLADLAMLGPLRGSRPDRPWTQASVFEQRLRDDVEALLALGGGAGFDAQGATRRFADEESADPGRAFALAFVLGSAAGDAPAEAAVLALRRAHPDTHAAFREALSLAGNPRVAAALGRLAGDADPALTALALEVLRVRRQGAFAPGVILLSHPDERVAVAAAACLGATPERAPAIAVLGRALAAEPKEAVAVAIAEALLALGDRRGLGVVRAKLEAESAAPALSDELRVAYLRLLAIAGDAGDVELFFRSLEPTARDAAAVGWFGHADLVTWLLGSLEAANEARRAAGGRPSPFEAAAAGALHRISGARPRDPADPGPPDALSVSAPAWKALWNESHARLGGAEPPKAGGALPTVAGRGAVGPAAGGRKLRFGQPYTPGATLAELSGESTAAAREDAALELAVITGGDARITTLDWVDRQQAALAAAASPVAREEAAFPPGTFAGQRLAGR